MWISDAYAQPVHGLAVSRDKQSPGDIGVVRENERQRARASERE
jgi:hypothetical protein